MLLAEEPVADAGIELDGLLDERIDDVELAICVDEEEVLV